MGKPREPTASAPDQNAPNHAASQGRSRSSSFMKSSARDQCLMWPALIVFAAADFDHIGSAIVELLTINGGAFLAVIAVGLHP